MKDQIFVFCFLFMSLWFALIVAFGISRLSGIADINVFVLMTLVVWLIEFAAVIWILRRR